MTPSKSLVPRVEPVCRTSAALFFLWVVLASQVAQGEVAQGERVDPILLSRLKDGALKGWETWEQQNRHIEAEYTEVRWIKQPDGSFDKDPGYQYQNHVFFDGDRQRHTVAKLQPNGGWAEETGVFRGGDYSFKAERSGTGGSLVATEVKVNRRPDEMTFPPALKWPFTIEHRDLRELLNNLGFHITGLRHEGNLVRIEFRFEKRPDDPLPQRFESGHVLLDPDLHWGITSYEVVKPKGKGLGELLNEYGPKAGKFVPLVRCTRVFMGKNQNIGAKEVCEFSVYRPNNQSDSFYTFEAVGLPNLAKSSRGGMGWFWTLNAGIILILAAWWLRRRMATH